MAASASLPATFTTWPLAPALEAVRQTRSFSPNLKVKTMKRAFNNIALALLVMTLFITAAFPAGYATAALT